MKTTSLWKGLLIGCLFLAPLTACASAPSETSVPQPTVTTQPTIASTASETPEPEPTATIKPTITPLPFIEGTEFPTGAFEQVGGPRMIDFHEDGTAFFYASRPGVASETYTKYGVNGNLYSQMKIPLPYVKQIPATYYWTYDGELLTFQVWGVDKNPATVSILGGQTYRLVGEAEPIPLSNDIEIEFPIGRFTNIAGLGAFDFDEDGTWHFFEDNLEVSVRSGKYVTNGNLYTEMTHDDPNLLQVPATYIWTYDGRNLIFELQGEDLIDRRKIIYDSQTYTRVDE